MMRALVVESGGGKRVAGVDAVKLRRNVAEPTAGEGEVVIKVLMAGICQTDLEIARGYMAFSGVLGHEFVGTVVKLGKGVDGEWMGKRVCGGDQLYLREVRDVCEGVVFALFSADGDWDSGAGRGVRGDVEVAGAESACVAGTCDE